MDVKFTRRNFIKFAVGAVAGIHVTPLPWKLTDDIAIWTQNWPWVPVPPTGEFTEESSLCQLCPGGCGITVRKVGERVVKIEGQSPFPTNPDGICPVGMGGLQLLYNESIRFTGPMRRGGMRGSGEFYQLSWDEALGLVARRIEALRQEGRPQAVVAIDGNRPGSAASVLVERFMTAIGSPNTVRLATLESTYRMGTLLMHGKEGPLGYDLENADYVLSFGSGLLEGWGAPGRVLHAWGMWHAGNPAKRRCRIVQVESLASNTASKADRWVANRPGTDAALALGLAHLLIREGLYDKRFVNQETFGFEDWTELDGTRRIGFKRYVLDRYGPERVAKITGVAPRILHALARELGRAKAPVVLYGKCKNSLNGSLYEFMAVHSLNALLGRVNQSGGVFAFDPLPLAPLPPVVPDEVARKGLATPRLDQAGSPRYPFTESLVDNLVEAILDAEHSPVDTLLVFSANPAYTLPDGGRFRKALKRIPFIVSFSPYKDETALMADVVLPDHTYLEKQEDIVWPPGLQYPFYGLSRPVLTPLYSTRHQGETVMALGRKIAASVGRAFPWKGYEEVVKARAKGLYKAGGGKVRYRASVPPWKRGAVREASVGSFEEMWKRLKAGGFWYRPLWAEENFQGATATPSGKFEFFSRRIQTAIADYGAGGSEAEALRDMGICTDAQEACLPHYALLPARKEDTAYPLRMMPYGIINLASDWIPSPPFLYKTIFDDQLLKDKSFVSLHPKTARENGLEEGDLVRVISARGEVTVRVHLFEGACPGVVYMPLGFGHTAYDEFARDKGANPNSIIQAAKDPLSGLPLWWNTPVRVTKV